jgi:hypothetical protein
MLHREIIDVQLFQEQYERQEYTLGKTAEFLNSEWWYIQLPMGLPRVKPSYNYSVRQHNFLLLHVTSFYCISPCNQSLPQAHISMSVYPLIYKIRTTGSVGLTFLNVLLIVWAKLLI